MMNEIRISNSIQITNGYLKYNKSNTFQADQSAAKGPTPGQISVAVTGTVVSLAQLTTPGICEITNLDPTNYVQYGLSDGTYFYPFGEVLPGETWPVRLYRDLGRRESYPGTGSSSPLSFMIRADTAACDVIVNAFNK